jgi:hypothetical protein
LHTQVVNLRTPYSLSNSFSLMRAGTVSASPSCDYIADYQFRQALVVAFVHHIK